MEDAAEPVWSAYEKFVAAGLRPSLHDGVRLRPPNAGEHRRDAVSARTSSMRAGNFRPLSRSRKRARQPSSSRSITRFDRLGGPIPGGVSGGAEHADASGGVFDDGQDVLALSAGSDGLDEVAGQQGVGLRAQEVGPGGERRSGAGPRPACLRISQTVDGETLMPSVVSSPWIRR